MPLKKNYSHKPIMVIGSGPAGMMAAGTAAKHGAKVILLERNNRFGRKLRLAGQGRANITNSELDLHKLISAYGKTGKFLYSPLTVFSNRDTIQFFNSLGVPTKTEDDGRIFPQSDKAADIITAFQQYLMQYNVQIELNSRVNEIFVKANRVAGVRTDDTHIRPAEAVILCTGGASYPITGSTGDGYRLAKELGHKIIPPHAALVPIEIIEPWSKTLSGITLPNIRITVFSRQKKTAQYSGDLIFTHFGISGPVVLDCSEQVGELMNQGTVVLSFDLYPDSTKEQLDAKLYHNFMKFQQRQVSHAFAHLLPKKLVPILLHLAAISPATPVNQISKSDRLKIVDTLKHIPVTIKQLRQLEEAMVTAGGIAIDEINSKTMESKLIQGLYFAGEVIDIAGKSGGYNLQAAFSTGYVAGLNAAKESS